MRRPIHRSYAFVVVALIAPSVSAQTPPRPRYRLEYVTHTPPTARCPDAAAFAERTGDFLGERTPFSADADRAIRVELSVHGRSVRGAYAVVGPGGVSSQPRSFVSTDCDRVVDDLVRSVGLAIDPFALLRAARGTPPPPPPPPAASNAATEVIPDPAPHERPPPVMLVDGPTPPPTPVPTRPSPHVDLVAGVGVSLGAAAPFAPSLHVGATLGWTGFTLGFEARADLPVSRDIPQVPDARYLSALVGGAVVPCFAWSVISACGVIGGGAVLRDATGVTGATRSAEFSLWAGARLAATWALGARVAVMAHGELTAPIVQAVPVLRASSGAAVTVWEPPPVQGAVGLRLVVRLR